MDVQLDRGVRGLEIDVYYRGPDEPLECNHYVLDAGTTCSTLMECLSVIKSWSDNHVGHHVLFVMVELKDFTDGPLKPLLYDMSRAHDWHAILQKIDDEVRSIWPDDRIVSPQMVMNRKGANYTSVRDAIRAEGWPTLGETRNRIFVMTDIDIRTERKIMQGYAKWQNQESKAIWGLPLLTPNSALPDGDESAAWSVLFKVDAQNSSMWNLTLIQDLIRNEGLIIRARADDHVQDENAIVDKVMSNRVVASGVHFIQSDFGWRNKFTPYFLDLPGGVPSRCNPISLPANTECVASDIELLYPADVDRSRWISLDPHDTYWCCGLEPFYWTAGIVSLAGLFVHSYFHVRQLKSWKLGCFACFSKEMDQNHEDTRRFIVARAHSMMYAMQWSVVALVMATRLITDVGIRRHVIPSDDFFLTFEEVLRSIVLFFLLASLTELADSRADSLFQRCLRWKEIMQFPILSIFFNFIGFCISAAGGKDQLYGYGQFHLSKGFVYIQGVLLASSFYAIAYCYSMARGWITGIRMHYSASMSRFFMLVLLVIQNPQLMLLSFVHSSGLELPFTTMAFPSNQVVAWYCMLQSIEVCILGFFMKNALVPFGTSVPAAHVTVINGDTESIASRSEVSLLENY
eukprot:TRINITY_DN3573_c0_g1_i1.p1 TRINITY_DN3573_c0_g1~~TRINITY_DN3573_c0_g1_i1.p1  ORF type:complete len:710 (-),score=150.62 TRINITY_DN3573_c0_g1_i1:66-1955(-)